MNPFFVWNKLGTRLIDLTSIPEIRMLRTRETAQGEGIYSIVAEPKLYERPSPSVLSGYGQTGIILELDLTEEEARAYIENIRITINSNRSISNGKPHITRTVSPEQFDKLKEQIDEATLALSATMSLVLIAVKDGDIVNGDEELTELAIKRLKALGSRLVEFIPIINWEDITWGTE